MVGHGLDEQPPAPRGVAQPGGRRLDVGEGAEACEIPAKRLVQNEHRREVDRPGRRCPLSGEEPVSLSRGDGGLIVVHGRAFLVFGGRGAGLVTLPGRRIGGWLCQSALRRRLRPWRAVRLWWTSSRRAATTRPRAFWPALAGCALPVRVSIMRSGMFDGEPTTHRCAWAGTTYVDDRECPIRCAAPASSATMETRHKPAAAGAAGAERIGIRRCDCSNWSNGRPNPRS